MVCLFHSLLICSMKFNLLSKVTPRSFSLCTFSMGTIPLGVSMVYAVSYITCLSKFFRVSTTQAGFVVIAGCQIFQLRYLRPFLWTLCQHRTHTANSLMETATKIAYPHHNHLVLSQKVLALLIVPLASHSTHHLLTNQAKQPLLNPVRTHYECLLSTSKV